MERLIAWSIDNKPIVLFASLIWVLVGVRSLFVLPIDAVPDVTNIQVVVNTEAPGLSPPEVESLVTIPVEGVLLGLPRVEQVRSLSKYGLSQVTVVFEEGTDLYFARQLVGERLTSVPEQLPDSVSPPVMGPIATGLSEIYQYQLKGDDSWDLLSLRTLQDWFVKRQLLGVDGVTEVNSFGGLEKEYQVVLDPFRVQSFDLTYDDIFQAIEKNNQNVGGGFLQTRGDQLLVRGLGKATGKESLQKIVVGGHNGTPILLGDVAEIRVGGALRQGAVSRDGTGEAVTGIVMMLAGENSRLVARRVQERVEKLRQELPEGVTLETFYNRTELVNRTLRTVRTNLLEGALLVVVVLFLFLGNLRASLIVASVIPLSFLGAAFLMVSTSVSGNLMSLGALDFGLVVDSAVVFTEHTIAAFVLLKARENGGTVKKACAEVARPLFFGVTIIISVYLPLLALTGLEGKMFRPMALTVVYALVCSLILSFTLIPVLIDLFIKPSQKQSEPAFISRLSSLYQTLLTKLLRVPKLVCLVALVPFVLALYVSSTLGAVFLPELDEGDIAVQAIRIPSVSLSNSLETARQIETILKSFPEVKSVISKTGRPDLATDPMGVEISDIIVTLTPKSIWQVATKDELVDQMRKKLEALPGINFSFSQPIELRVEELLSGTRSDVALQIYGEDLDKLAEIAQSLVTKLRKLEGATDVNLEQVSGVPYLNLRVDPAACVRYGIPAGEVLEFVERVLGRQQLSSVIEGERIFPVVAKLPDEFLKTPEALQSMSLRAPGSGFVPLSVLVIAEFTEGVAQVNRVNGQRRATISMNFQGQDLVGFVKRAQDLVGQNIPGGYVTEWGGEFENFERASERLIVLVPIVMLGILFFLWLDLRHWKSALLIYLNVPFAAVGGVFALGLRGMPFSISAGVGFLTLFGVAVLNGLVLMSAVKKESETEKPWAEALQQACESRLRPVLMTALTTLIGFVPMALSTGAGAEVQKPLATVVIGGLFTSTCLTLLVLPSVMKLFLKSFKGNQEVAQ